MIVHGGTPAFPGAARYARGPGSEAVKGKVRQRYRQRFEGTAPLEQALASWTVPRTGGKVGRPL